jgi:hypothetical protein
MRPGRSHPPQIVGAKLRALCDGAALAGHEVVELNSNCLCGMNETKSKKA